MHNIKIDYSNLKILGYLTLVTVIGVLVLTATGLISIHFNWAALFLVAIATLYIDYGSIHNTVKHDSITSGLTARIRGYLILLFAIGILVLSTIGVISIHFNWGTAFLISMATAHIDYQFR
jgi:uncharacterized membrane protein (Fun14 family)